MCSVPFPRLWLVRTNISFQTTINYEKRKRKRIVLVVVVVVVAVGKKKEN
jgi:hypothetical protein